jgi:hypothetical protein
MQKSKKYTDPAELELMEDIHRVDLNKFNKLLAELKEITNSNERKEIK